MTVKHTPVLLHESLDLLDVHPNQCYIDATFGRGGHTGEILSRGGKVVAFDQDHEAIIYGQEKFKKEIEAKNLILVHENFSSIQEVIAALQADNAIDVIKGILFDFGTSTDQLTSQERGFSFIGNGPLDMRMDTRLGVQAKDLLAVLSEKQLEQLFREYGGEDQPRAIAKAIKQSKDKIETVEQLSTLVERVKRGRKGRLHPATKVFQALRIAVNSELYHIEEAMKQAFEILDTGGNIVTIAFHEGEDRIAKSLMRSWENNHQAAHAVRVKPTQEEVEANVHSRSAVLRKVQKL